MSITIYHNPRCSKSRQALEIITNNGITPLVKEYLKDGLSPDEVKGIYQALELESALPMIRVKEAEFQEAGLSKESSNAELFDALVKFPKLLERPIVITDKGARICRPPELATEIL
jgi:arsenate reductase